MAGGRPSAAQGEPLCKERSRPGDGATLNSRRTDQAVPSGDGDRDAEFTVGATLVASAGERRGDAPGAPGGRRRGDGAGGTDGTFSSICRQDLRLYFSSFICRPLTPAAELLSCPFSNFHFPVSVFSTTSSVSATAFRPVPQIRHAMHASSCPAASSSASLQESRRAGHKSR